MTTKKVLSERIDSLCDGLIDLEIKVRDLNARVMALEKGPVTEQIRKDIKKIDAKKPKKLLEKKKIVFTGKVERTVNAKIRDRSREGYKLVSKKHEGGTYIVKMEKK